LGNASQPNQGTSNVLPIEPRKPMLYTVAVVLPLGGFVHVLLVIAVVMVLLRLISGRKPF